MKSSDSQRRIVPQRRIYFFDQQANLASQKSTTGFCLYPSMDNHNTVMN